MREAFQENNFRESSLATIDKANSIISEYQSAGFTLTLRQLYYQFVARGLLENSKKSYDNLGNTLSKARLCGLVDWDAIEDRTRFLRRPPSWDTPQDILLSVARSYRENPWRNQRTYVEVWIEKDALVGVVEPACNRWRVPYFACRGYTSQSEQYTAGKRLAAQARRKKVIVFHLGDHDPSGIDMTRDNDDRLAMFSNERVSVRRLALNWDQVEQYDPPPNPTKDTDSRSGDYRDKFGESCWELDALDPTVINDLLEDNIKAQINHEDWEDDLNAERVVRSKLNDLQKSWTRVASFLDAPPPPRYEAS